MRHCHRSISHDVTNFKLDNFVNFSSFSSPQTLFEDNPGEDENFLADKIGSLLHGGLYLNLRDKVIKILPTHWVQRIVEIVSFQIGQHNFSQIPLLCTFNHIRFSSLPHMVTYVCNNAFTAGMLSYKIFGIACFMPNLNKLSLYKLKLCATVNWVCDFSEMVLVKWFQWKKRKRETENINKNIC